MLEQPVALAGSVVAESGGTQYIVAPAVVFGAVGATSVAAAMCQAAAAEIVDLTVEHRGLKGWWLYTRAQAGRAALRPVLAAPGALLRQAPSPPGPVSMEGPLPVCGFTVVRPKLTSPLVYCNLPLIRSRKR